MTDERTDRPGDGSEGRHWGFLYAAAFLLALSVLDYLVMDSVDYVGAGAMLDTLYTVFALMLLLFVGGALFSLVCFTNARLGALVAARMQYLRDAWAVPMRHIGLGGWGSDSASDAYKLASRRMQHRHARRRFGRQDRGKGS